MAAVNIPFPQTSLPGETNMESGGRLINCFCEPDTNFVRWRVVPGLSEFANIGSVGHRGIHSTDDLIYSIRGRSLKIVDRNGNVRSALGEILGTDLVTIAHNNRKPARDVVCVSANGGAFILGDTVTSYTDGDLPSPNSVSFMDGYFIFTCGDSRIFASELNDTAVNPLSFTTANAYADALLRGTVQGSQFFAWGANSIEIYQDAGTLPFPLARSTVIPVGLAGRWAVAGYEDGFVGNQVFVANDDTVRMLDGYNPIVVSTKAVERYITAVDDKSLIVATAYVFDGSPYISISGPNWTWVFNQRTGFWHERKSHNQTRWMVEDATLLGSRWVMAKRNSGKLLYLDDACYTEDGDPITMEMQSDNIKDFPYRSIISSVFLDFSTGNAPLLGSDDETHPKVSVTWSWDGGNIWSNEVQARSLGPIGEFRNRIRVNRLGMASHHGMVIRFQTSSPVYRSFMGGKAEYSQRGPA